VPLLSTNVDAIPPLYASSPLAGSGADTKSISVDGSGYAYGHLPFGREHGPIAGVAVAAHKIATLWEKGESWLVIVDGNAGVITWAVAEPSETTMVKMASTIRFTVIPSLSDHQRDVVSLDMPERDNPRIGFHDAVISAAIQDGHAP
jgi:hypothetical protein